MGVFHSWIVRSGALCLVLAAANGCNMCKPESSTAVETKKTVYDQLWPDSVPAIGDNPKEAPAAGQPEQAPAIPTFTLPPEPSPEDAGTYQLLCAMSYRCTASGSTNSNPGHLFVDKVTKAYCETRMAQFLAQVDGRRGWAEGTSPVCDGGATAVSSVSNCRCVEP